MPPSRAGLHEQELETAQRETLDETDAAQAAAAAVQEAADIVLAETQARLAAAQARAYAPALCRHHLLSKYPIHLEELLELEISVDRVLSASLPVGSCSKHVPGPMIAFLHHWCVCQSFDLDALRVLWHTGSRRIPCLQV